MGREQNDQPADVVQMPMGATHVLRRGTILGVTGKYVPMQAIGDAYVSKSTTPSMRVVTGERPSSWRLLSDLDAMSIASQRKEPTHLKPGGEDPTIIFIQKEKLKELK